VLKLDFLLFNGSKTIISSEGVSEEISKLLLDKSKFVLEFDEEFIESDIRLIPIKNDLLAYAYNYWYKPGSKEDMVQASWVVLLSKEDFLSIYKSLTLIREVIIDNLQSYVFTTLQVKDFDDLRKRAKKMEKKLPFRLDSFEFDEKPHLQQVSQNFLKIREEFITFNIFFKNILDGLLESSQFLIKRQFEQDAYNRIANFIKFIYYIVPVDILFSLFYSAYEKDISLVQEGINFFRFRYKNWLEKDDAFQNDLRNKKKFLIEIDSENIDIINDVSESVSSFSKYLGDIAFKMGDITDIIRLERLMLQYNQDEVYKKDLNHLIDFLDEFGEDLNELSRWMVEKKTDVILLYSSFNNEKQRFDFIKNNKSRLNAFRDLYSRYRDDYTSDNIQYLDTILEDLAIKESDEAYAKSFSEIAELIDKLRRCPFEALKRRVPIVLENKELPKWLLDLRELDILSAIEDIKKISARTNMYQQITQEISKPPRLEVEVHGILGEYFMEMIKAYEEDEDKFFYKHFINLLTDIDDFFLITLITNDEIINFLQALGFELFLDLEAEVRTEDNFNFIITAVWLKIIHGITYPVTTWTDEAEGLINEIRYSINKSEFKEELEFNGWEVPKSFKEILIKILEVGFLERFLEFKDDYIDFYSNVYDNLQLLKQKYTPEEINRIVDAIMSEKIGKQITFEMKFRKMLEVVDQWKETSDAPNSLYKVMLDIINEEGDELFKEFQKAIEVIEDLIISYSNVFSTKEQVKSIEKYILGKELLDEEMSKVNIINELITAGIGNLLLSLKDSNKQELINEIRSFIKDGTLSASNEIGTTFYNLFIKLQKDKEELYSEGFKEKALAEAFVDYLETRNPISGFLNYSSFSGDIEEIAKKKRQN